MSRIIQALAALPLAAAAFTFQPSQAEACGGCFVPPEESTQVTGHRMLMSVSMTQSTLVDQIVYTGDPASFAWVLPTKGKVDVGLSSDLIFNQLGVDTAVTVAPPPLNCPSYTCPGQYTDGDDFANAGAGGAGGESGGVEVIAQEVVGPYETVQLSADDPNALGDWLASHGFKIPEDIKPIVGSYVAEGFNFLALKLIPGVGIDRIQPVRVTTQGSNVVLPLRMVAAGTGAVTAMTLWVLGDGRYEAANRPNILIPPEAHVWDYEEQRSNRSELMQLAYQATNGYGWLVESALPYSADGFRGQIMNVVSFAPDQSGYSADYQEAEKLAQEDLDVLLSGLSGKNTWISRLRAEASRESLGTDLQLQAGPQTNVPTYIQCEKFVGTQPACPPPPPGCDEYDPDPGSDDPGDGSASAGGGSGCTVGSHDFGSATFGGSILLLLLGLQRRRTRRAS